MTLALLLSALVAAAEYAIVRTRREANEAHLSRRLETIEEQAIQARIGMRLVRYAA